MGPTASNKTTLTIKLHKILPIKLININSTLIYKKINIKTAKPNTKKLLTTPHQLLNIHNPSQTYSATNFHHNTLTKITNITTTKQIPLLINNTILYFKTLLKKLSPLPSTNPKIQTKIKQQTTEQN